MKGSIFKQVTKRDQDGNPIQWSDNWTVVLNLGKDPATGKRKQRWFTVQGNKHEAEKRLRDLLQENDHGMLPKPGKLNLGDFLNQWLKEYAWPNLAPKTAEGYEHILRKYVIPGLGRVPLAQLKPEAIQKYYTDKLAGGLSARTVRHHHVTLHTALQSALKRGIISRNPADAVDAPRFQRPEMHTISEDDLQRFLNAAENSEYYPLFYLALFTGMRRSELLALRWCDVDLLGCQISVTRSKHHLRTGEDVFRQPKTAKSRRMIALSPSTSKVLQDCKAKRESELLHAGQLLNENDLIFPWLPDTITHAWLKLTRRLGLKNINLHSARHSHASLLLKQGVHPKIVQERLGHSSIQITLDTYSHVAPGLQQAAANGFDDFIRSRKSEVPNTPR